jgi:ATP-dependent Zn protease
MKNLLLGAVLGFGFAMVLALMLLSGPSTRLTPETLPYSRFITEFDDGKIEEVTFQGPKVFGRFKDHHLFETLAPSSQVPPALIDRLLSKSVRVTARPEDDFSAASTIANWTTYFISLGLFFSGLWFVMARPVLALARQLDAYVKATHPASTLPPPHSESPPSP